jgi:glycosyltransferase involved in cell wall biosynthesis
MWEEPSAGERLVAWKLAAANPALASVRFRCLVPAAALKALGWSSVFLHGTESLRDLSAVDAIVFVKAHYDHDLALARQASAAGVPIVLDFCTNVTAAGYDRGAKGEEWRQNLPHMMALCSSLTTTGPYLADELRRVAPAGVPIVEIPDPVDTPDEMRAVFDVRGWRAQHADLRTSAALDPWPALLELWRHLRNCGRFARSFAAPFLTNGSMQGGGDTERRAAIVRPPGQRPDPARPRRILWFGSDGGTFSWDGIGALASIADDLIRLHRSTPIHLVVVSTSIRKYRRLIEPLPLPTSYREWGPLSFFQDIASADVVILPYPSHPVARAKSSNRAVLALSLGVPVVASATSALEPLRECILLDDWEGGIRRYLDEPLLVEDHLRKARDIIDREFKPTEVGRRWDRLLRGLSHAEGPCVSPAGSSDRTSARAS